MIIPKKHLTDIIFTMALFCVFALVSLLVVHMGAGVYRQTVNQMDTAYQVSVALTYVSTKIRLHDTANSVFISPLGSGYALVLNQEIDNMIFQTWIYYYQGTLREIFVNRDNVAHIIPLTGQALIPLRDFRVAFIRDNLISISVTSTEGTVGEKIIGLRTSTG